MPEWNNYIMRKYGGTIRANIFAAHIGFYRGTAIISLFRQTMKEKLKQEARDLIMLEELSNNDFFKV